MTEFEPDIQGFTVNVKEVASIVKGRRVINHFQGGDTVSGRSCGSASLANCELCVKSGKAKEVECNYPITPETP